MIPPIVEDTSVPNAGLYFPFEIDFKILVNSSLTILQHHQFLGFC
jgi:hypothetical protein